MFPILTVIDQFTGAPGLEVDRLLHGGQVVAPRRALEAWDNATWSATLLYSAGVRGCFTHIRA